MSLVWLWFIIIATVWTGFFVLEGFDFGVGILHGVVGAGEAGRRAAINSIGPLWDGNEVWLIVAGAATFAAFPGWYATMFSAFYLALVLLLCALMARGTSFEFRGKLSSGNWQQTWSGLLTAGSLLAPVLIGIALGDLLTGLPVDRAQEYTGSFWTLFQPYGVFTGLTLLVLCVLHGSTFLALKTRGEVYERARGLARLAAPVTALMVIAFAWWTHAAANKGWFPSPVEVAAMIAAVAAVWLVTEDWPGWAFAATTVTMGLSIVSIFAELYPRVMVSSTSPAYNLTVNNTASGHYALMTMTIVVAIFLPVVLAYQTWTYYVFRRRLSPADFAAEAGSSTESGRP